MAVKKENYLLVRLMLYRALGGKCSSCGKSNFMNEHFHLHHIDGTHLMNGENHTGRGRDVRMWDAIESYCTDNILLVCEECHKDKPEIMYFTFNNGVKIKEEKCMGNCEICNGKDNENLCEELQNKIKT